MDLALITPLILTYNEAPNIDRTLQKLTWAKRIIVVDSYSTDQTVEILKKYPQIDIYQRSFDSFANQCNFGLSQINTAWVLSLDADYILGDRLVEELKSILEISTIKGFYVPFKYCVFGKPLRGTLLPPRCILYQQDCARYENDGHAHRVKIRGQTEKLNSPIYHDDRKSLSRWLWAQDRYMIIEAKKIAETPTNKLSFGDKIRKQKILAPFIVFVYCLILKGGILDGWQGWFYALQRLFAEVLLALKLIEIDFDASN